MVGPKDRNQKVLCIASWLISLGSYHPPGGCLQGNCYHSALLISSLTSIQSVSCWVSSSRYFQPPAPHGYRTRKTIVAVYRCSDQFAKEPLSAKVGCETHISYLFQPNNLWNGRETRLSKFLLLFTLYLQLSTDRNLVLSTKSTSLTGIRHLTNQLGVVDSASHV